LECNVPFHHKYGYIRDKWSGVDSNPYPVKEGTEETKPNKTKSDMHQNNTKALL